VLQKSTGLHVWIGICSERLVGPFFFQGNVTADSYLEMINDNVMPDFQTLNDWGSITWQQDGAPPHWALRVRDHLNQIFGTNWIGRDGQIHWPPRSPDLTPCDFFVWGHLKNLVYSMKPTTIAELRTCIIQCCALISQEMCENACRSVGRRLEKCIGLQGAQVISSD